MARQASYYGLILAGGRGTRFWPRSRRSRAKQVLRFLGERSLIQQTMDRLSPVIPPDRLWVLTNEHLRTEIVRQLPEIPKSQILAEPTQRNTAPAIGLAAHILESIDPHAVMGVFPSDHMISKPARYLRFVRGAFKAAAEGKIAVLGIQPRWPETGYGYIEFPKGGRAGSLEPLAVRRFREKPDLPLAKRYVQSGNFYWNAGMFFWKASVLLNALREFLPKTATLLASLPAFANRRFASQLKEVFPHCENISIDYAVLEKARNVVGFATDDFGWNDVGQLECSLRIATARWQRQRGPRGSSGARQLRKLHRRRGQAGSVGGSEGPRDCGYPRRPADCRPVARPGSWRDSKAARKAAPRRPIVNFRAPIS